MSATWRCSAAYYAWDGYYSDEYSDDDYTDQDDYTDYDDSGSEYDDERSEYDDGRDFGLQYYLEEGYDAIYLNHNTRSWNTGYTSSYLYMYLYHTPSYGHKRNLATEPRNNTANWRIYQAISLSTPKTSKNDCDRRQGYSNLDNTQRDFYGANRHTNDRAASMPPISYGRASSESTSPRNRRAATCEPRLLFTPSPGAKSLVAKGREFEDYFAMGVEKARGNITAKVEFQKRLNITPGCKDKREFCKPDAVFTKGKKGAIVEMKNYEGTSLGKTQIDKTYKDMCALKDSMRSTQVSGYIYVRRRTRVNQSVVDYARTKCISIVREGEVDADELAELVDRNLKI